MKSYAWILLCVFFITQGNPTLAKNPDEDDTLSIWVNGLCGMCRNRIEEASLQSRGVESASWDAESRMLSIGIDPDKFKERRLHYNIASAGHDTKKLLAPDPVYEALPMCCKYRDFKTHDEALGRGDPQGDQEGEGSSRSGLVSGQVYELGNTGTKDPLVGANIYWMGSTSGTISDDKGRFSIEIPDNAHMLIVSYVGYGNDTIHIQEPAEVEVEFSQVHMLEEVSVVHRVKPISFSFSSAYNIQNISEKELTKAACCNLSESFETNPSVDVSFTDAVTGVRKIEMLGLAGPYVQITRENMPDVRGLSALYGLTYTPGPWIEGMQLNMGAGSVVNGFESITGQINVELRKPENSDRLFLNLYGNNAGRMEANLNTAYKMNEQWYGGLMLHGNMRPFNMDHNGDGFMDHPTGNQLIALKRFKYSGQNGLQSQFGIKLTYLDQTGGQSTFDRFTPREEQNSWGSGMNTSRFEAWGKVGRVFENKPYTSIGFQFSGLVNRQDAFFGLRDYMADQQSLYSNLIYQSILGNTNHQYRTGISFQMDSFEEKLTLGNYSRFEWVPGVFLEYTYNHMDIFSAVAGLRADRHNNYGIFFTPRLHLRYEPVEKTVFRASTGRGLKTASIFAENIGIFASSRTIFLEGDDPENPYGMDAEIAWSYGINFAQGFRLGHGDGVINLDYYHTLFENQIVVDLYQSAQEVHIYNLDGKSFSNSLQVQVDIEPVRGYDIRFAYRFNDVKTTFDGQLLPKPLLSRNRAFINMAYTTLSHWSFDITWNWQDGKQIPGTGSNPELHHRRSETSPAFSMINLQVSKGIGERLEIYSGLENLFDYVQEDPIIASEDPFGPYFDSSLIWGPIFGRKLYAGLRYRID